MHAILEYLAVGILLVAVLLAIGQTIEVPTRTTELVKAEQLFTVAERLMDKILLTPGYPENWGYDILSEEEITDFGLALAGASAPYVVDPDKVMRLANLLPFPNPAPISAERIAELLGIKGTYGFRLEMKPMITANVETIGYIGDLASVFRIQVVNWYGIGLPNAYVLGTYVVAPATRGVGNGQPDKGEIKKLSKTCITDSLGYCILDFSDDVRDSQKGHLVPFLILHIDWEGFISITGYSPVPEEGSFYGYVIGNIIFIKELEDITGTFHAEDVIQVIPQYAYLIKVSELDVIEWCRTKADPEDPWCHKVAGKVLPRGFTYMVIKVRSIERLSSHIIVTGTTGGREKEAAIVISRMPKVDISYGLENAQPANAVTLTRVAQIYNYPYIVRLTIWRWVEGWP